MAKVIGTDLKTQLFLERILAYREHLPEYKQGVYGQFTIKRKVREPDEPITVRSFRNSYFSSGGGVVEHERPLKLKCDAPIDEFYLEEKGQGVWMSSTLQEIGQMDAFITKVGAEVLIGGLGLGVLPKLLVACNSTVRKVTVVEINKDLIKLIGPLINHPKINIVHADLFDFIKTMKHFEYRYAFFDIWQSTGEWTWQTMVVPLKRVAHPKIRTIECWLETEMMGQVEKMLYRAADMDTNMLANNVCTQHYWTFRRAVEEQELRPEPRIKPGMQSNLDSLKMMLDIEEENSKDPKIRDLATTFLTQVGGKTWERMFGTHWDETLHLFKKEES